MTTDPTAWDDWRWQLANSATTLEALKEQLNITPDEVEAFQKWVSDILSGQHPTTYR